MSSYTVADSARGLRKRDYPSDRMVTFKTHTALPYHGFTNITHQRQNTPGACLFHLIKLRTPTYSSRSCESSHVDLFRGAMQSLHARGVLVCSVDAPTADQIQPPTAPHDRGFPTSKRPLHLSRPLLKLSCTVTARAPTSPPSVH